MNLLLDTGILGQLCHPGKSTNQPVSEWVEAILKSDSKDRIYLPEVCDYELRRKLLHLISKGQSTQRSISRLNELCELLDYLPVETATFRMAAEFWSKSRSQGSPTASIDSLDGDVILAAQTAMVGGTVVTTNRKHLSQFVPARNRSEIIWGYAFVCIRGPVDNIAFEWSDHFLVQDSFGRTWHCRQEALWHSREEMLNKAELVAQLMSDVADIEPMYRKLISAGHRANEPTSIRIPIFVYSIPVSRCQQLEDLAATLAEDLNDIGDAANIPNEPPPTR